MKRSEARKTMLLFFLIIFLLFLLPGLAKWYLDAEYPDAPAEPGFVIRDSAPKKDENVMAVIDGMPVRHGWKIAGVGDLTPQEVSSSDSKVSGQ